MSKPSDKPTKSTQGEAWRPRMDNQRVLHSFSNVNQEPDPLTESPNITDPNEDTAPLQGSLDRSDDDAMVDEYRASDEESPRERPSAGGADDDPSADLERARSERTGRSPKKGR